MKQTIKGTKKMTIIEIITTVGFPIACCIALGAYVLKRDADRKEEQEANRTVIAENTKAITNLSELVGLILEHEREDKENDISV